MKFILNMKKRMNKQFRRLTCFVGVLCMLMTMSTFLAAPAMADATRVVTLGQDLSDEQEAFIVNYFGVDLATARVIYVNNWQEREILGSWIPLEQIGNITISSAYVQPTNSGGIQVRTANLTYVTGNMIASVLSTAGITNCNVIAAAPFPVSGTGALTGVMIAYQAATGEELDNTKRDLAVQEFTVTQQASGSIGENEALQLVNAVKMEVLQSGVSADDKQQITEIVDQVVSDMDQSLSINGNGNQIDTVNMDQSVNVDNSNYYDYSVNSISNGLSEEDRQMLIDLAAKIAEQDYDKEAIMETLERVNDNLADKTNIEINVSNGNNIDNSSSSTNTNTNNNDDNNNNNVSSTSEQTATVNDEDSIFENIGTLPDDVITSATDKEGIEEIEEKSAMEPVAQEAAAGNEFPEMVETFYVQSEDGEVSQQMAQPQMPEFTETIVPEPQQTEQPQMPEPTETIVPEQQQTEQPQMPEPTETIVPEQPQMPEPTETIVPEPQQTEQPQMPEFTETIVPEPQQTEQPQEYPAYPEDTGMDNTESLEQPQEAEMTVVPGQWQTAKIPEGQALRPNVQEVWDKLGSVNYEGVELEEAVYLGSQDVGDNALNYEILCVGSSEGTDDLYMVIMYESAEGDVYITRMTKIDLDELAQENNEAPTGEALPGEWQFSRTVQEVPTSVDQVTASLFGGLPGQYPEKDLTAVMLLATKQSDVTEYAVLCYEIPEGAESGFYEVAFVTGDQFGYITDSTLVPLDLAEYNS